MTKASYDDISAWYDALVRAGSPADQIVVPPLFELVGNVQGQRVCDLACGTGRIARALGFTIECLIEPRATGLATDRIPDYAVVPAFMLARSKKD